MMNILIMMIAVVGLGATDRFYDDIDEQSPDGAYQVTAKSPDNQQKNKRPWQINFQVVLIRKSDNNVMWTRAQEKDESSPVSIRVSNTGAVIIRDGSNLITLINLNGQERKLGDGLSQISETEVKKFCDFTTAGTFWTQFSVSEFIILNKTEYYYMRLYWGSYLLYSVDGHKFDKKAIANEIEMTLLEKYSKLVNGATEIMDSCSCCNGKKFRADLQIGLMVMKFNKDKVTNDNVSKIIEGEDNHWPSLKDYYQRL
jgi:hypothetical protein